jgi:glycosyltransferase involved in cell wall biosynthesis
MPFKINNEIVNKHLLHYVPHGINHEVFKPLDKYDKTLKARKKKLFGDTVYDFVIFYNSRNVQRKKTANTILAFRAFCDNLTPEEASKCVLVLHTEAIQDAGTDLPATIEALCTNYKVIIDEEKQTPEDMCANYSIADVTVLISSNEGFGLSVAESIICGTPVVVNVTGGLQDQIGQVDNDGNPVTFNSKFGTNNSGKYRKHGVWAKPVWPVARGLQGSPPTPYIFDDWCTWEEVAEAFMYWYLMKPEDREKCGLEGRRWAMNEGGLNSKNMCAQFIKAMDYTLEHFVPSTSFGLYKPESFYGQTQPFNNIGVEIPVIDKNKLGIDISHTLKQLETISIKN